MGIGDFLGKLVGGIGNLFGGGGGGQSYGPKEYIGSQAGYRQLGNFGGGSTGGGGLGGALAGLFGQQSGQKFNMNNMFASPGAKLGMGGLGLIGSQMIGNPKAPPMSPEFDEYMKMMMSGGTPGMSQAGAHWGNILSGQNKDAYDAAGHALEQSYQEQLRNLNSQYKSLRPGTDITTDSAYRRDMQQLQDQYARRKAEVMAGVQNQAAQGLAGLGGQQMGGMMTGINQQLDQIANQWQMSYAQKEALRNQILGLGVGGVSGAFGTEQQSPWAGLIGQMFQGGGY